MIKLIGPLTFILISHFVFSEESKKIVIPTVKMADICAFDERCRYAFSDNGQIYPIKPEVGYITANFHEAIVLASERYGVDPRSVAGAILAENTMNVQLDDEVQNFLAKNGITSIGSKTFSYGLGQLNEGAAMDAEIYMAKLEKRPARSRDEISRAILDPKETISLIAGYMRYAQDTYKSHGHDISNRPDILATLYNLGGVEEKASRLTPETPPKVNFFGAFVANNIGTVENVIGWSPEKGKYKSTYLNHASFNLNHRNRPAIDLQSRPPTCTSSQQALQVADLARSQTFNGYRKTGELVGWYQITNEMIDCEMQRWVLVNGLNGVSGWVNHYELAEKSNNLPLPSGIMGAYRESQCQSQQKTCLEKIAGITGTNVEVEKLGLLNVTLNSFNETAPSLKNFNSECLRNQLNIYTGSNSNSNSKSIILNGIQLPRINKMIEDKKKEIMKAHGVSSWRDVDYSISDPFHYIDRMLQRAEDFLRAVPRGGYNELVKIKSDELKTILSFDSSVPRVLNLTQSTSSSGKVTFANPGGGSVKQKTYSSQQRNPAYSAQVDKLYRAADRLFGENHSLNFKEAGSAPNVSDLSQPLGPASAPRGSQAKEMTKAIEKTREVRKIFEKCSNFADDGMTFQNFKVYLENERLTRYVSSYLNEMAQTCELFNTIESGDDLSQLDLCAQTRNKKCSVYYLDANDQLDRASFNADHIRKHKDLLKPHDVIKKWVTQTKEQFDSDLKYYNRNTSSSGDETDFSRNCSYDPITTNQKIEQLAKLDCINNIQVPEGEVFSHHERYKTAKVMLGITDSDSQYQITINKCIQKSYTGREDKSKTDASVESNQ